MEIISNNFLLCHPLRENFSSTIVHPSQCDCEKHYDNVTCALLRLFEKFNQTQHIVSLSMRRYHSARNLEECQLFKEGEFIDSISSSVNFVFFVTNMGQAFALGKNYYGQQGVGDFQSSLNQAQNNTMPLFCDHMLRPVIMYSNNERVFPKINLVVSSLFHSMLLTEQKQVFSTGYGVFGQLGLGSIYGHKTMFTHISKVQDENGNPIETPEIEKISLGAYHSILMESGGKRRMFGCGLNNTGCLGLGDCSDRVTMTVIPQDAFEGVVVDVRCGYSHTIFLSNAGRVYGCGQNYEGQLSEDPRDMPSCKVPRELKLPSEIRALQINCGFSSTVIVGSDHNVYVCGGNAHGSLAIPLVESDQICSLTKISWFDAHYQHTLIAPNDFVTRVHCGISHTLFETFQGRLFGNGSNMKRQLGREEKLLFTSEPLEIILPKKKNSVHSNRVWCVCPFSNYSFCVEKVREREVKSMMHRLLESAFSSKFSFEDIVFAFLE